MKKMFAVALFLMNATSFADDTEAMAKVLASPEAESAIEKTLSEGMYAKDARYFRGILKSNVQSKCIGNRVAFDLQFDRYVGNGEDKSQLLRCTLQIVYGACGSKPVDKVSHVGKLSCPPIEPFIDFGR